MTLPASGAITLAQINTELGLSSTAAISLNAASVRALLGKASGAISLADGYGKSAKVYATWDPANKTAGAVTLSNGNLTASISGNNYASVRSTISKTAGKWYWEVVCGTPTSISIGIASAADSVDNWLGNGVYSVGYSSDGAAKQSYRSSRDNAGYTTGDVIGVCLDAATGAVYFLKNNVAQPYGAWVNGTQTWFAVLSAYFGSGGVATANFGATPLVYTPPAGYNPGLYN